jgi:3-deoxy-7-phosphoheptulonate synthase
VISGLFWEFPTSVVQETIVMASPKSTAKKAPAAAAANAPAANDSGAKAATWSKSSWRGDRFNKIHIPFDYPDVDALQKTEAQLGKFPPLVFAGETRRLKNELARVAQRKAFLFQGGDCAESFAEHDAQYIRGFLDVFLQIAVVLTVTTGMTPKGGVPIVKIGRVAGQFAKPRSSPTEKRGTEEWPSYRGDIINGPEFNQADRIPNPQRLLDAYRQSAATMNFLRALVDGGYASLTNAKKWVLDFEKSPVVDEYRAIMTRLASAFEALEPFGGIPESERTVHHTNFYTSHEALLLGYEEALTRQDTLLGTHEWFDTSAHMVWIGDRTRGLDHACVEYCRGIANPIGLKCGPSLKPAELVELIDKLNPRDEAGRLTLICRFGADKVRSHLPPLIEAVEKARKTVVWSCDPMHGNTISVKSGNREFKTRRLEDVKEEINGFFDIHETMGTYPGGVHVEMTSKNVTECTGGGLTKDDLGQQYDTLCDPRLNADQSLELAFMVADRIKGYRHKQG